MAPKTWNDLKQFCETLTPDQLRMPVEFYESNPGDLNGEVNLMTATPSDTFMVVRFFEIPDE